MKRLPAAAGLVSILVAAAAGVAGADSTKSEGTVVVAKSGAESLVLWDVTPLVASIVQNKTPRDEALHALESQAVDIASAKAGALPNAKTITVRIIYQKTGDISPTYKTATFTGVERVVSVSVEKSALGKSAASYARALAAGKTPAGVTLAQSGQLPPI